MPQLTHGICLLQIRCCQDFYLDANVRRVNDKLILLLLYPHLAGFKEVHSKCPFQDQEFFQFDI